MSFFFHEHAFIASNNPEVLYCSCGKIKDLHQHQWTEKTQIVKGVSERHIGYVLECSKCGDIRKVDVL